MSNKELNDPAAQSESFIGLIGKLFKNLATMVRDEIELVVQGVREKIRGICNGVLTVAVGAAVIFAAFLSFCAALIIGLTYYMNPVVAAIVTGVALALIGTIITLIGYKQLKESIHKK